MPALAIGFCASNGRCPTEGLLRLREPLKRKGLLFLQLLHAYAIGILVGFGLTYAIAGVLVSIFIIAGFFVSFFPFLVVAGVCLLLERPMERHPFVSATVILIAALACCAYVSKWPPASVDILDAPQFILPYVATALSVVVSAGFFLCMRGRWRRRSGWNGPTP